MWWKVYLLIVNNVIIKYNKKGLVIKKIVMIVLCKDNFNIWFFII